MDANHSAALRLVVFAPWRELIKRGWEVVPLLCLRCGLCGCYLRSSEISAAFLAFNIRVS